MASFYSEEELINIGFKKLGKNCLISRKASIYGQDKIIIGNNVRIDDFSILSGHIEIGNYVHIAAYSALYGGEAGIFISDFAGLSCKSIVYSVSDDYSGKVLTNPTIPDEYKNVDSRPVYIKKHVLIGASSVVMPGVSLEEGSSFGVFSFINRSSEPWSINAGIPFKKIKDRNRTAVELEKKLLAER